MQKFPLAVIGAGVIGRTHIERILATPEFDLVGVAEPSAAGASGPNRPTPNLPDLFSLKEIP